MVVTPVSSPRSALVQAPHQRLAHPRHAQHTEALEFQLVQDYARRVIDIVFITVKKPGERREETDTAQVPPQSWGLLRAWPVCWALAC